MQREWYQESFGSDYLVIYKHRDLSNAKAETERMISWLQLAPGSHILDLCCGMGRHSLALADAGYQVTGVDLSETLLQEAKQHDSAKKIQWLQGDMRCLPIDTPFDAVVNLFTSFGYFLDDEENHQVIQEIHRMLKPGGKFIIDFLNPKYVIQHLVPYSEKQLDGLQIEERRTIEEGCVVKRIQITDATSIQTERHYLERVKLYQLEDFKSFLSSAQLSILAIYGDYFGGAYDAETSPRLIIVGCKEGA